MSTTCNNAALARVLRIGDTALIRQQRLCEWVGAAYAIEEDIAQANIALDLLGQARAWLTLAGEMEGNGRGEDDLAYFRDAGEFDNFILAELPNGDFAHTVLRQFFFDAWHEPALRRLEADADSRIAGIAASARRDVAYHLRHSDAWVRRLGGGTAESRRYLVAALEELWPWCGQLFDGVITDDALLPAWLETAQNALAAGEIELPPTTLFLPAPLSHGEHLSLLLAEMQSLARAHPQAQW